MNVKKDTILVGASNLGGFYTFHKNHKRAAVTFQLLAEEVSQLPIADRKRKSGQLHIAFYYNIYRFLTDECKVDSDYYLAVSVGQDLHVKFGISFTKIEEITGPQICNAITKFGKPRKERHTNRIKKWGKTGACILAKGASTTLNWDDLAQTHSDEITERYYAYTVIHMVSIIQKAIATHSDESEYHRALWIMDKRLGERTASTKKELYDRATAC